MSALIRFMTMRSASSMNFDVLVVGGGHAGCEAAAASARMGANTLLISQKLDTIGEMSCNPSFGGVGKGHLLREIDALDGVCPKICDLSGMHYRILNKRSGPAVWGHWANIDRKLYKSHIQQKLFCDTPNLVIQTGNVDDLIFNYDNQKPKVEGVLLDNGQSIFAKNIVIATGTFLSGEIFIGLETHPAGRIGEEASDGLSKSLDKLGFRLGRLKTGTPPRLDKRTIDFSVMTNISPDIKPDPFSFMNDHVWIEPEKQKQTYLTKTTEKVADICHKNAHLNLHIKEETRGVRHCPSLESKILKFKKIRHQIWIENEGFDSDIAYPQGISMTFSPDIQLEILREIPGLQNVEMTRNGYGVQYDFVDSKQLKMSLETKIVDGLFLCGQINGTTGYEEAAAQGILAGINAGAKAKSKEPLLLNRTNSYIGVLVDDLTSLGTDEPYRMFTARSEFRLCLRPDNADLRLTSKGREIGVVSDERYETFTKFKEKYEFALECLHGQKIPHKFLSKLAPETADFRSSSTRTKSAFCLMSDYRIPLEKFIEIYPEIYRNFAANDAKLSERLQIEALYLNSTLQLKSQINEVEKEAKMKLPENLDYSNMTQLSYECREKLNIFRPETLNAASRIPGITPTALYSIMCAVKNTQKLCEK